MELAITDQFAALSHPTRLSVLRLLMRRHPDVVSAGEIAQALDLKPNTLSGYLAQLHRTGLIRQTRFGTSLRYGPNLSGLRALSTGLFETCCNGRPDLCPPAISANSFGAKVMPAEPYRVLFICTGNSARSIFAETILRSEGAGRFEANSAGTKPSSELNPLAVEMLESKGHDISGLSSKNVAVYQADDAPQFDFVFTVCDRAANEDCPAWPGQPLSAHWSTPDPVKATGTEAERMLAFQQTYGALRNRILAFTALPLQTLDAMSLQAALDDISQQDA